MAQVEEAYFRGSQRQHALKNVSGEVLRFFMLQTHYRSPIDLGVWDWNDPAKPIPDGLVAARAAYETFVRLAERVGRVTGRPFAALTASPTMGARSTTNLGYAAFFAQFVEHMNDDFNTGGAVGVLFELVTALNRLADAGKLEGPGGGDADND